MIRRLLLLSALVFSTTSYALEEGFTEIKHVGSMTEYRYDSNGLTVLLQPDPTASVVTYMVTYRIGSRNESYGTTGATHLLEHMMFKGTTAHNKEAGNGFDQLLESTGAETNATTWIDRTNYFTTLAPQHLPLIVRLEADRMRNLRLREEDLRPEMTVVLNEFDVAENDPATALLKGIWATAFQAHPYRHSVLGWLSDVENIPMAKLRDFYQTYYWPNNATVSVVGNFSTDRALALIKQHYGAIPRSPQPIPQVYTVEPPQTGPRRFTITRPGELGMVMIAYKIPAADHRDCPALSVFCDLMADGLRSRFYQELTEEGFTTDVIAYPEFARDPSLLLISAELAPEVSHQEDEEKLLELIKKVQQQGVSAEEVKQAIIRIKAQNAYARDGSSRISENLTEAIATGDWSRYFQWEKEIEKVTPADIKRVAQDWLKTTQSTTGWYIASEEEVSQKLVPAIPRKDTTPTLLTSAKKLILPEVPAFEKSAQLIAPQITRSRTGGIDLVHYKCPPSDVVTMLCAIPLGDFHDPTIAAVMASLFERGTTKRDASRIEALLDETGAEMEFSLIDGILQISCRCLTKDYPAIVSLLAEQLQSPAFDREEISVLCDQMLSETASTGDDTESQADIVYRKHAFPIGHPLRLADTKETTAALRKIKRKNLMQYHRTWITPDVTSLIVVGDIDAAACSKEVQSAFGTWQGTRKNQPSIKASLAEKPTQAVIPIAGKESISVRVGQASGISAQDPDYLPLEIATAALGSGFTSRLLSTVRDTEGLTYGISASLYSAGTWDGSWEIYATFAAEDVTRGLKSTFREIKVWHQQGLRDEELAYHKSALIGQHRMMLASAESTAQAILSTIQQGLPLTWLDEKPEKINQLTLPQVNDAIKRRIRPDTLITVKCGSTE